MMGWWDDIYFFFHVALYVKYNNFLRLLKPGPSPFVFPSVVHIIRRVKPLTSDTGIWWSGMIWQFGCWKSSFSTSWIPRWESLKKSPGIYFQDKSNLFAWFAVLEKEAFAKISFGLVWPVLPVSSSKHASAADAKLCLTRRMPSKFWQFQQDWPGRCWRSEILRLSFTSCDLWCLGYELHGHTCLAGNCSCSPNFGGSEFLYGLAQ